jgi:Holliday junction resolvase RusA-like endonuclease
MISLTINDLPKMPNMILHAHWRNVQAESKKWHGLVKIYLRHNVPKAPFKKAKLILTRYSMREPDYDGLVGSFKYVVDGLVKAGVIVDDKFSVIGKSEYKWEKCKKIDQRIEVSIENVK